MIRLARKRIGLACLFLLLVIPACDPSSATGEDESDTEQNEPSGSEEDSEEDLADTLDSDELDTNSSPDDASSELEDTGTESQDSDTDFQDTADWVDTGSHEEGTDSSADTALYVDVRTAGEYAAEHYPGAIHIPLGSLVERQSELYPQDRPIIVYCASGSRSAKAKVILEQEGFTNVEDGGALSQLARLHSAAPLVATRLRNASGIPCGHPLAWTT